MKNWTNSIALALMAATLTLTAAACTEDAPATITEAEPDTPEAFDPETVYEVLYDGASISGPVFRPLFLRFADAEAKRAVEESFGGPHPSVQLVSLDAARAVQVKDNRPVVVIGATAGGGWRRIYTHNPLTPSEMRTDLRRRYCPSCPEGREEVRR